MQKKFGRQHGGQPRFFENNLQARSLSSSDRNKIIYELFRYADIVEVNTYITSTIYTGRCGTALMLYRIGKLLQAQQPGLTSLKSRNVPALLLGHHYTPKANMTPEACYTDARKNIEVCIGPSSMHPLRDDRITFIEGHSGPQALLAVLNAKLGSSQNLDEILRRDLKEFPESECEILYGRCGYLMSIYFVRKELNLPTFRKSEAVAILSDVLRHGVEQGKKYFSPLMYSWHDTAYIGAAHGLTGILHAIARFKDDLPDVDRVLGWPDNRSWSLVLQSVEFILTRCSYPSGNIKSSMDSETDKLVHWCHGAPGVLMLLVALKEADPSCDFAVAAEKLGEVVWMRGLLKKGVGLCHGIGGNGLALLRLANLLNDSKWIQRANEFALFGIENFNALVDVPDHPNSLFEGLAGFVWFLCDLLEPSKASFPGMD